MPVQSIQSKLFIDLSTEEQQIISGGQVSTQGGQQPGVGQGQQPGGQTGCPQDRVSSPESLTNDSEGYSGDYSRSSRRRFPIRLFGYLYYR